MVSAAKREEGGMGDRAPTEALVALAQLVVAGAGFERLAREAVQATARALGADRCELLRASPDGSLVRVASSDGGTTSPETDAVPGGVSSVAGYALLCGTPVFSGDLGGDRRFGGSGAPPWDGAISAVAAPVPGRDGAFGVLVAFAARADAFGAHHALSLARTASMLGAALRRLEEREDLRRKAEDAESLRGSAESDVHPPGQVVSGLTGRQLEILRLMATGRPAKRIASDLGLSVHTVRFHQRNLYRALGVGSATGALRRAVDLGLLA